MMDSFELGIGDQDTTAESRGLVQGNRGHNCGNDQGSDEQVDDYIFQRIDTFVQGHGGPVRISLVLLLYVVVSLYLCLPEGQHDAEESLGMNLLHQCLMILAAIGVAYGGYGILVHQWGSTRQILLGMLLVAFGMGVYEAVVNSKEIIPTLWSAITVLVPTLLILGTPRGLFYLLERLQRVNKETSRAPWLQRRKIQAFFERLDLVLVGIMSLVSVFVTIWTIFTIAMFFQHLLLEFSWLELLFGSLTIAVYEGGMLLLLLMFFRSIRLRVRTQSPEDETITSAQDSEDVKIV